MAAGLRSGNTLMCRERRRFCHLPLTEVATCWWSRVSCSSAANGLFSTAPGGRWAEVSVDKHR